MNVTVTLTETSHDGYYPIIKNGQVTLASGDTANIAIGEESVVIDVMNSAGIELPNTGGPGTSLFAFCGLGMIASSLMYFYHARRRRENQF